MTGTGGGISLRRGWVWQSECCEGRCYSTISQLKGRKKQKLLVLDWDSEKGKLWQFAFVGAHTVEYCRQFWQDRHETVGFYGFFTEHLWSLVNICDAELNTVIQTAWKQWWNFRLNPVDCSSTDLAISFWIKNCTSKTFEKKIPFHLVKLFQHIRIENKQFQTLVMQSITFHSGPVVFDRIMTIFKLDKSMKKWRPIAVTLCGPIIV